jgi:hypothetical protein
MFHGMHTINSTLFSFANAFHPMQESSVLLGHGHLRGSSNGEVQAGYLSTWSVLEQFSGNLRVPQYPKVLRYLPGTTAFQDTRRDSAHEVYAKD